MSATTTERTAPVAATARRVRPSDVVLAIWLGVRADHHRVGRHGRHLRVPRRLAGRPRGVRRHPEPAAARLLRRHAAAHRVRRRRSSRSGCATTSGAHLTAGRRRRKNIGRRLRDFRAGIYMQTLLRDPAAGVMHSMIYFGFLILFGVTTVLEIDHQLPESAEVPPRRRVPGLLVRRRRWPVSCSSAASLGPRCGATCSGRTASASRPSPSTRSSSAMFFVLGVTGFAHRDVPHRRSKARPDVREVVLHRLPAVRARRRLSPSTLDTWHQVIWVRRTSPRSSPSS